MTIEDKQESLRKYFSSKMYYHWINTLFHEGAISHKEKNRFNNLVLQSHNKNGEFLLMLERKELILLVNLIYNIVEKQKLTNKKLIMMSAEYKYSKVLEACKIKRELMDIEEVLAYLTGNNKITSKERDRIYNLAASRPKDYKPFQFYIFNQAIYFTNLDILIISILYEIIKDDIKINKFYTDPTNIG